MNCSESRVYLNCRQRRCLTWIKIVLKLKQLIRLLNIGSLVAIKLNLISYFMKQVAVTVIFVNMLSNQTLPNKNYPHMDINIQGILSSYYFSYVLLEDVKLLHKSISMINNTYKTKTWHNNIVMFPCELYKIWNKRSFNASLTKTNHLSDYFYWMMSGKCIYVIIFM